METVLAVVKPGSCFMFTETTIHSEFSICWITPWCWVEIISTQHLLSISTQHLDEKYSSHISPSGAYHDLISHPLKWIHNAGRNNWLKTMGNQPYAANWYDMSQSFHALPWWMLCGIPLKVTHCYITVFWAVLWTAPTVISPYSPLCGWGGRVGVVGIFSRWHSKCLCHDQRATRNIYNRNDRTKLN